MANVRAHTAIPIVDLDLPEDVRDALMVLHDDEDEDDHLEHEGEGCDCTDCVCQDLDPEWCDVEDDDADE